MTKKLKHYLLACILFSGIAASACPVWLVGYVKIVDESGKVLPDAKFWYVYKFNDSFKKSKQMFYREGSSDTDSYRIYEGGGYEVWEDEPFDDYYRIQCPGYTDVVIGELKFGRNRIYGSSTDFPTLYIVMYHDKFIQKGDYFIKLDQYYLENVKVSDDSTVINIQDYSKDLMQETAEHTYERVLKSSYQSYPNPVKDKMTLEVKDSMPQPFKVKVYDLLGKVVFEAYITEPKMQIDLADLSEGSYYIRIDNTEGEMKHCMRFIKS